MACPIKKVGDIYFPDVDDNDDNVSGDNVDNADQINDTSNGFRLLHQNDIKTSLQRIKRPEKPTDSLKLRIKRPEKSTDRLNLNLISTSDGLESLLRNWICSTACMMLSNECT